MEYTPLGRTGVRVSQLCMGTMTFGAETSTEESLAMFQHCRDVGINFFDCANKYADGEAEKILGKCIANCRDEVVITSKGTSRVGEGVNELGASRKHLMIELEKSLKRLATDYIDIYLIHYYDSETAMSETLRFLDNAVRQGKILYTGVSNWSAWQTMKAIHICESQNLKVIDCVQPMYSLVKRQAEVEIFPLALDQQLGVVSYSPVGAGLLTGKYKDIDSSRKVRLMEKEYYNKRYGSKLYYQIAEEFKIFADKCGINPAALAIRWVMKNPAVTSPIIGARNVEQLKTNLSAVEIDMSEEFYSSISALSLDPSPAHDRLEENVNQAFRLR